MRDVGVVADTDLPWPAIFGNDRLYQEPIAIMQELYRKDKLAEHVIRLIRTLGIAPGPLR
jgi:hypothetical protein